VLWRGRTADLFELLKKLDLEKAKKLEDSLQNLKDTFESVYPDTRDDSYQSLSQPQTGSKRKAQSAFTPSAKKAKQPNTAPQLHQTPRKPLERDPAVVRRAQEKLEAKKREARGNTKRKSTHKSGMINPKPG
jgi:hypothetical protein